jgi:N-carbamoylputrescine amidase
MTPEVNGCRTLRVAAVQMHTVLGQTTANLAHATPLVEQAAHEGAEAIVLPELAASGYALSLVLWGAAERRDGTTVHWLQATAQRLGAYLGIGFVEADGEDLYNTYALGAPDGSVAGFVRKTMAETAVFRCAADPHVVETPIGRLGVGICADNHFVPMVRRMAAARVELMLLPHAVPTPFRTGGLVSAADRASAAAKLRDMAPLYARLLGVPAVFANQVGPRGPERWVGLMGRLMPPDRFRFGGLSTIADRDGTIVAQMDGHAEGVALATVTLDAQRKVGQEPVRYGRYGGGWLHPAASGNLPRDVLCTVDATLGWLAYRLSRARRARARAVSSGGGMPMAGASAPRPPAQPVAWRGGSRT